MASPLVTTKLTVPPLRSRILDRSRLTERLGAAAEARLTLISAPAGFGKTTAVTAWLARPSSDERAIAWVSLDDDDSHAATFWTYVVAALQSVLPDVGATVLSVLQSGQLPTRALLATLVNEVSAQPVDVDLVLDDYHLADGPDVSTGMAYLLDHLPPNLHVVVTTRADPDLPLARLRARGELVEVRARDLRFTADEVSAYLDQFGGLAVDAEDVAALAERTEGWAAALQLAALSMQGRDDVASFVAGFAGDDRYVVDYLADEVLFRQSDDVRDFLLRTCVLERLTGDLCDAVTGGSGGRATLQALDRANLFLVPLDDRRRWYRYHHLFADVLRAHLASEHPDQAPTLHRRASDWFAAAGEPVAAVRHALAAAQVERAADLVEAAVPGLRRSRDEATIRAWADDFPDDVVRRRPVLALGFVGGLLMSNEFGPAEERLREVERWMPAINAHLRPGTVGRTPLENNVSDPDEMVVVDEDELARVPAAVETYRAALALVHGDLDLTIACAERAAQAATADDHVARGSAAALSGLARWAAGDLDAAHAAYSTCVGHLRRAGHLADVVGCTITLADIRITQGRLADAQQAYDDALRLARAGPTPLRGAADMHVGLAEVALERGDPGSARDHLERASELGETLGLPQLPYRLRATSAMLAEAGGDPSAALDLLTDAEQVYLGDFSPDVRPLHARKARVLVSLGDVDAALGWADEHGVTLHDEASYRREFEHVTFAEVLLAQYRRARDETTLRESRALLARLLTQAEHGGRVATVLDVLVLASLAADSAGEHDDAVGALRRATALGAREGHVRVFARHGLLLFPVLDRLVLPDDVSPYVERLRAACRGATQSDPAGPMTPAGRPGGVVEPLTTRELEVLRLLASELDGPDIARQLVVSLHTLRAHTKSIYAKLGVNSRRAAVRRAHDVGLPLTG